MKKQPFSAFAMLFSLLAFDSSACPEFLDVEMRKLGSRDQINFCEAYSGKALLIVNTASNCGYAHQFTELERLHQRYKDDNLAVIGFSSDDFFQEEDDEGDAATVCYDKYKVTFPVMATTSVRGENANQYSEPLVRRKVTLAGISINIWWEQMVISLDGSKLTSAQITPN